MLHEHVALTSVGAGRQVDRVGSQQPGLRQLDLYAALLQALAALGIQGLTSQAPTLLQPPEVGDSHPACPLTARCCAALVSTGA